MRYFFASFRHSNGFGNILIEVAGNNYANQVKLTQRIKDRAKEKDIDAEDIIILNIVELSKQDYEGFIQE